MSHNTLLHRALRPAIRHLARTSVTPDQLTALRFATGLLAGACFAAGPGWRLLGCVILLASLLLDRADGELARQTRRFSRWGWRLDLWADCLSTMVVFIGLGAGVAADAFPLALYLPSWGALILGMVAAVSTAAMFWLLHVASTPKQDERTVPIDPDDLMLLLPVLVALDYTPQVLLTAILVLPVALLCVAAKMGGRSAGLFRRG